ncbi:MAG TPA: SDR family oxidoreductase [Burkholderiaceae bacterium]|nr:SDR family oxidoreductase [Burkholderiaceae bacterium]
MPTALILGASRGIGLEFARQYLAAGWTVYGTHRGEDDRIRLRDLGAQTLRLDVQRTEDIAGIAWQLDGERIDVAVVNAGVYGPRTSSIQQPPTDEQFDLVMRTNVLAAMRLLPILAPLLAPAQGTLAFVSSRMGSIAEAGASYGMLYRVSKAAVNMVAKLAHADYGPVGIRVLALHPGWVRTDMGGPNADVAVEDSIAGMRAVIADRAAHPGGQFLDWRGQALAW